MLTQSAAFLAAQASAEQSPFFRVVINFPSPVASYQQDVSDCVVSLKPTRSVTTALPEQATLISGLSSADIEITLAGMLPQALGVALDESDTIDKLFRPNDASADLYRQAKTGLTVTVQQGFYVSGGTTPEYAPVGIYTVDTPEVGDGYVILTCRDALGGGLSSAALLPPINTQQPYNDNGLTSEFALERMVRYASPKHYLTRPVERAGCVLSVGYRASVTPDVGTFQPASQVYSFGPGLHGTALTNTLDSDGDLSSIIYTLASPLVPAQSIWMEAFCGPGASFYVDCDFLNTGIVQYVTVYYDSTQIIITTTTASGQATQTWTVASSGKNYVAASIHWTPGSTSVTGTIYLGASTHGISLTALNARSTTANFVLGNAQVDGTFSGASLEALQVTPEGVGAPNNFFQPTFLCDPSLNPLIALPDVSGKTVSAVTQEICEAEAGVFLIDESDIAHFVNRETIRAKTSVTTITSTDDLSQLTTQEQESMLATHVQVAYAPLQIQAYGQAWSSTDKITVRPGATVTVTAKANILSLGTTMVILPNGGGLTSGQSGYRAAHRIDGSGSAISNLVFTITQTSNVDITITIRNPNGFPAYLVSPTGAGFPAGSDGDPILYLGGLAVVAAGTTGDGTTTIPSATYADAQWPPVASGGAAANPAGDILYSVPANDWRQDRDAAQSLADHLLSDLAHIKPLYRNFTIKPDSTLQLLDVVTLADSDVSQTFEDVLILGIAPVYSQGDWAMAITAIAKAPSGAWLLGIAGKSELGITTYAY